MKGHGKYGVVLLEWSVSVDDLQGYIKQFHLVRHLCLVPFRKYPLLAVHLHNLVGGKFFQVHEGKGSEGSEDEQITHEGGMAVLELVRYQCLQLVLREERTLLRVRLTWSCANGFLGILPLKCARITTPLSHMQFIHIVAFLFPFSLLPFT